MTSTRLLGGLFGLAGLYYVSFYLLRHDPTTVVQAAALFVAAAFLMLQERPATAGSTWFGRSGLPVTLAGWTTAVGLILAVVVAFALLDSGSHSASDTIIRTLPTFSLIAALAIKLVVEHSPASTA